MTDRYAVAIDGRTRAVELEDVEQAKGDTAVRVRARVDGGPERLLDVRDLGGGLWSILDEGEARLIQVDGASPKLTVEVSHPDGEPRICVAEVADAETGAADASPRAASTEVGPLVLRAPIPGRLVKVLVKPSDRVESGQTLMVLEAMKMENELRAPRAGVIAAVHAREGAAVETGQHLISLD